MTSCLGKDSKCYSAILGAAGDVIEVDTTKMTKKTLMTDDGKPLTVVDKEIKVTIDLPQSPGDKILYNDISFTQGETINEGIGLLLINEVAKPGSARAMSKNMEVKMYRHFNTDPAKKWTEVGFFETPKEFKGDIGNTRITLKPDGKVIWKNPATEKETLFDLSKKNLKAE